MYYYISLSKLSYIDNAGQIVLNSYDPSANKPVFLCKVLPLKFFYAFAVSEAGRGQKICYKIPKWQIYVTSELYEQTVFDFQIVNAKTKVTEYADLFGIDTLFEWVNKQAQFEIDNCVYLQPETCSMRFTFEKGEPEQVVSGSDILDILVDKSFAEKHQIYKLQFPTFRGNLVELHLFGWEIKALYYLIYQIKKR